MPTDFKILILEDNQSDADLLKRELKKNGLKFTVKIVEDRRSFEQALENFFPDIILSDYSLPAFDGITAFNVKQDKLPDVPFIMVSGSIGEERSVELIKTGITDYVLKDKLFSLSSKIDRALKEAEEKKEKRVTDIELKEQYEKLLDIAFVQSHQLRAPVANILGLFSLFDFDNPSTSANVEILAMLKIAVEAFDQIIREIVLKTSEIKKIAAK